MSYSLWCTLYTDPMLNRTQVVSVTTMHHVTVQRFNARLVAANAGKTFFSQRCDRPRKPSNMKHGHSANNFAVCVSQILIPGPYPLLLDLEFFLWMYLMLTTGPAALANSLTSSSVQLASSLPIITCVCSVLPRVPRMREQNVLPSARRLTFASVPVSA